MAIGGTWIEALIGAADVTDEAIQLQLLICMNVKHNQMLGSSI